MNLTKALTLAAICFPVFAFSLTLEEGAKTILESSPKSKGECREFQWSEERV